MRTGAFKAYVVTYDFLRRNYVNDTCYGVLFEACSMWRRAFVALARLVTVTLVAGPYRSLRYSIKVFKGFINAIVGGKREDEVIYTRGNAGEPSERNDVGGTFGPSPG